MHSYLIAVTTEVPDHAGNTTQKILIYEMTGFGTHDVFWHWLLHIQHKLKFNFTIVYQ
jgi:hypothetical protein